MTEPTETPVMKDAPVVVRVSDVSKRFTIRKDNSLKERIVTFGRNGRRHREDFWALKDVSIDIRAGETVGLIGHNGSGKSTLLKVMGGIIEPTDGTVESRGRIAALLELGAGFHPDLTGRENVFLNASVLGLSRKQTEDRFDDILAFSEIGDFIDTQVKFYSSGMYVRLAFAVAVHTDPDILIVDEVLAVGDEAFQLKCMNKIKSFQTEGRTIILVTHSMGQVQELCDRVVLLNRGKVVIDDEPSRAVSEFRDILEVRRLENVPAEPDATTLPEARIVDASVRPGTGAPGDVLQLGDDLRIDMAFDSPTNLEGWICAVQIDNAHGQKVYGTASDILGDGLPPLDGRTEVQLTVRAPMFGTGMYFVNVSLLDYAGRHLHDRPQVASFKVEAPASSTGVLSAEPVMSFSAG